MGINLTKFDSKGCLITSFFEIGYFLLRSNSTPIVASAA
jgi:hypothetical protein